MDRETAPRTAAVPLTPLRRLRALVTLGFLMSALHGGDASGAVTQCLVDAELDCESKRSSIEQSAAEAGEPVTATISRLVLAYPEDRITGITFWIDVPQYADYYSDPLGNGHYMSCNSCFLQGDPIVEEGPPPRCSVTGSGSIIDIDAMMLIEEVPIVGTDFSMVYSSGRVRGRQDRFVHDIQVTPDTPASGDDFTLHASVGDLTVMEQFPNATSQRYMLTWDGRDGGEMALGSRRASIQVTQQDPYQGGFDVPLVGNVAMGGLDAALLGLGGWMPGIYHFYDVFAGELLRGDGTATGIKALPRDGDQWLVPDGDVAHVFDSEGRHLSTRSVWSGATLWTFEYEGGRLSAAVDVHGRQTVFGRGASGDLQAIIAPGGESTAVSLTDGLITALVDPAGNAWQMTYWSSDGLLKTFAKPVGEVSDFEYDSLGRLTVDRHSGGFSTDLEREPDEQNAYQRTIRAASAGGRITELSIFSAQDFFAETYNRVTTLVDGRQEIYRFDKAGADMTASVTSPNGSTLVSSFENDPRWGEAQPFVHQLEQDGVTTLRRQELVLADTTDPLSVETWLIENETNGETTVASFEAEQREWTSTSAEGRVERVRFDAFQRPIVSQSGSDLPVTFEYEGPYLSQVSQGTRRRKFAYDAQGRLTSRQDEFGTTQFAYDAAGRVSEVTLPDRKRVLYRHDGNGRLVGVTPPGRSEHVFDYGDMELLSLYRPPDVGLEESITAYSYDADRRLSSILMPDGRLAGFSYPTATQIVIDTVEGTYFFDEGSDGNVRAALSPQGLSAHSTYESDRLVEQVLGDDQTGTEYAVVEREFDQNLRLASESVIGDGVRRRVDYAYDADGLLIAAGELSVVRDEETGRVVSTQLGGVSDQYTYDVYGDLVHYKATFSGQTLYELSLSFDKMGRLVGKTETSDGDGATYRYVYSPDGKLVRTLRNGSPWRSYSYDENGNRQTETIARAAPVTATFDERDRILTNGSQSFVHDANGNMVERIDAVTGDRVRYRWDTFGQLTSVELPNGEMIRYFLDADGRRAARKAGSGAKMRYVYTDDLQVAAELIPRGRVTKRFVYAVKDNIPDYYAEGASTFRIISDHLGSPRLVVDAASGGIIARIDHDDFGRELLNTQPGLIPFGFAGGFDDSESGLLRFGAREYDPALGRWLGRDPILFEGDDTNLYGYVGNRPTTRIDPTGLFGVSPGLLGGGGSSGGNTSTVLEIIKNRIRKQPGPEAFCKGPKVYKESFIRIPAAGGGIRG